MTELVPTQAGLANWSRPLEDMAPDEVLPRALALASLAKAAQCTDPATLHAVLDTLEPGDDNYLPPVYVKVRREHSKHGKIPASALPTGEWD